jgi:hypothetical protein
MIGRDRAHRGGILIKAIEGTSVKAAVSAKPFRFSEGHRAKLTERFARKTNGLRFVRDLQKLVGDHLRSKEDRSAVPAMPVIRANASAIQKAARQLTRCVTQLEGGEKELLGQMMWTIDKQRYYPRGFSVDQLTQSVHVLEQAARQLSQSASQGGRPRLQLDGLIRDIHAAYVVRFNGSPELSMSKDNDFSIALKICLQAVGERPKALLQLTRDALHV